MAGHSAHGTLAVPATAPFFNDHFPRRPVFPATLMLDAQIDLALAVAAESPHWPAGIPLAPVRMTHVKVRSFTLPGQVLRLGVELRAPQDNVVTCMLSAQCDGKPVATARVDIRAGEPPMTARRRVAITGVGLVTPVGNDVATTWDALLAGKSGGAEISLFDASGFSTHIAAEVKDFRNTLVTDRKLLKFTNRSHRFALEAAEQAMRDAGIRPTAEDAHALGLRRRRRHDDGRLRRSPRNARARGRRRRARRQPAADGPARQRSAGVLSRAGGGRARAA